MSYQTPYEGGQSVWYPGSSGYGEAVAARGHFDLAEDQTSMDNYAGSFDGEEIDWRMEDGDAEAKARDAEALAKSREKAIKKHVKEGQQSHKNRDAYLVDPKGTKVAHKRDMRHVIADNTGTGSQKRHKSSKHRQGKSTSGKTAGK